MTRRRLVLSALLGGLGVAVGMSLWLAPALAQSINIDLGGGDTTVTGRVVQLIALMTVLSLAPSILLMVTSYTRIIVVFSFVRTAMGTQNTPPAQVIASLALFMTLFIMMPTFEEAYDTAIFPLINGDMEEVQAFETAMVPFHDFMMKHVREEDLALFADVDKLPEGVTGRDVPLRVLVPAFMISELRRAFEMGFLLFVPFLVIDMVVASVLMSMGMMMLPPVIVSLPFKIIFFVLVDGWHLLTGSLIRSFGG